MAPLVTISLEALKSKGVLKFVIVNVKYYKNMSDRLVSKSKDSSNFGIFIAIQLKNSF